MPRNKSRREIAEMNNAAHRLYGAMFNKPPMMIEDIKPKRVNRPAGSNPDAPPLEREVLKEVWSYLSHHPKVAWVTRVNSGGTYFDNGNGGQQFMRFNYKRGMSDIIGQLITGKFLAVECKRLGAKLEPHQSDFINEVNFNNGLAFVARCVADCERELA